MIEFTPKEQRAVVEENIVVDGEVVGYMKPYYSEHGADRFHAGIIQGTRKTPCSSRQGRRKRARMTRPKPSLSVPKNVYVAPVTVAPTVAKTVATSAGNITQAKEVNVTVTDLKAFLTAMIQQNPAALAGIVDIKVGPLKAFVKANGLENYPGLSIQRGTGVRF